MNDNTQTKSNIESVGLATQSGEMIVNLINLFGKMTGPLRVAPGVIDTELMTAAVTFAGCIHGELIAMGMMDKETREDDKQTEMLVHNYRAGIDAGIAKVDRLKANRN